MVNPNQCTKGNATKRTGWERPAIPAPKHKKKAMGKNAILILIVLLIIYA
jgi:hypothetical protein